MSSSPLSSLLLLGFCCFTSVAQNRYFEVPLDPQDRLHLFWDVYYDSETVVMELHASVPPVDWLAIGFSDYGEMTEADLCVLWVDEKKKIHLQDMWTNEEGVMFLDSKQNCVLADIQRDGETTVLVFRRKFDTCDDNDYVIEEGTTHIIYATGEGPVSTVEGIRVTDGEFGLQRIQLLKNTNPSPPLPDDVKTFSILNKKVHVPADETTYWCSLHRIPHLPKKHHIVQYEAAIQKGNEALVHHMEVFHCEVPGNHHLPNYNAPCENEKKSPSLEPCKRVLAAWAMGALPLVYPEEAGSPIGGPDFSSYVMLEVHYNNPEKRDDWIDSSGIMIYYTSQLREHDVGIMELGLQYTPKMAIPPRQPGFTLAGHCIVECTDEALPPSGIVVFGSQLHTHLSGIRALTRHVRGGVELLELNRDNHYSPHFQEIRILKRPVLVLPGDALVTTCTYRTSDRENVTVGGLAISDEMCVNYIHYYPKTNLEVCKSSIDSNVLDDYFQFMHEYENQPTSEKKGIVDNYHSIDWTPLRSQLLYELYEAAPLSMQCNQSNGERFPGYWENINHVHILKPLPAPERNCPV